MNTFLRNVALVLLTISAASAESTGDGDAAFLFAYQPTDQAAFDAGYRTHLDWHRNHRDPLVWYGWYVVNGEHTGTFVDGTFGLSFSAYDNRIAPADDAADFGRTTAPHGKTRYRGVFRLQRDLSTSFLLEDRSPSRQVDVLAYRLFPGRSAQFEGMLAELVDRASGSPAITVYRQLSGAELPLYLVMLPRDGFAAFGRENSFSSIEDLINVRVDASSRSKLLETLSHCVRTVHAETWRYREDLSYFPDQ